LSNSNRTAYGNQEGGAKFEVAQASATYGLRAKSGPRSHFILPQRHFVSNEKTVYSIYEKFADLAECNTSQSNHITQDLRPSNWCTITYVALGQKRSDTLK